MADKVSIVFVKPWQGYNAGERAGFGAAAAAKLIRGKYARPFVERAAVTKDTPPTEPEVVHAPEDPKPKPKPRPKRGGRRSKVTK